MTTQEISAEILRQLGGKSFIAMTGSNNLGCGEDKEGNSYLQMNLRKNNSKAQYLNITLNDMDLYDMTFYRLDKNWKLVIVKEEKGIYDDMLQGVFTEVTGLDTHL